jgi:16S rRNA (cytidine1402-2'-O)-methyltransferase
VLYLVSTPIGNLKDLSFRALDVLKQSSYILCEDTRRSRILLNHYSIEKPLKSFHRFNERMRLDATLEDLVKGEDIALISDAGTPAIADPGLQLLNECRKRNLPITAIPGACALIVALGLSGFSSTIFQFLGFIPKKQKERSKALKVALEYKGTSIFYETPHQIKKTLAQLQELDNTRPLCIVREATKLHEECLFGEASILFNHFQTQAPLGEMVLLISGNLHNDSLTGDVIAHINLLQEELHITRSEAIKVVAKLHQLPKREIYKQDISH